MIIHAGEKPFPWCFCDKTFAYHATAKKHELFILEKNLRLVVFVTINS